MVITEQFEDVKNATLIIEEVAGNMGILQLMDIAHRIEQATTMESHDVIQQLLAQFVCLEALLGDFIVESLA